jgi:4-amino-4-deoxy-L-arabinose transferase-like glycosyltransferase
LDEHGNSWPIHFQSFNDYKPGLYFYLVLPLVKFFGLNVWSVRIPNAPLGVISIGLLYYLVKELFKDRETTRKLSLSYGEVLGLVSAFMLTISPWHIHFSRGGWEVNAATFFILLGAYLFVKGRRNLTLLMLSVLSFSLSMYTYHAARIISPLLGMSLLIIYRKDFKGKLSNILIAGLILLVTLSPLAKDFLKSDAVSRAAGVGLFADPGPLNRINEQRGEHGNFLAPIPILFHNKAVNYGLAFLENWSDHFHGEFLFLNGDVIERNRVPETGQMYLIDLVFLLAGFIGVIKLLGRRKKDNRAIYVILLWLVVAPMASALTFQSPHALRAQNMVVPLTMLSAMGLLSISFWIHDLLGVKPDDRNLFLLNGSKIKRTRKLMLNLLFMIFVLIYAWEFTRYLHNYYLHLARQFPFSSQYGVEELVDYVKENGDKFDKVVVTDRYDQPYVLFLFYMKYPPERFQNDHTLTARDNYGFSTVRSFGKYEFKSIDWDNDQPSNPNSLIIGIPEEISDEANIVKEIYGCNGYKYFEVVAN